MDYYRDYLRGHLRDHRFPRYTDKKFIEARTEEAYDRLITLHLEGHTVSYANEMAMRTLLAGLYVSRYDIIYNVVEENLSAAPAAGMLYCILRTPAYVQGDSRDTRQIRCERRFPLTARHISRC